MDSRKVSKIIDNVMMFVIMPAIALTVIALVGAYQKSMMEYRAELFYCEHRMERYENIPKDTADTCEFHVKRMYKVSDE